MDGQERRVERAQALLEETLSAHPFGLPSIALVDRLEHWGFPENEGMELLQKLQDQGLILLQRGRYLLR